MNEKRSWEIVMVHRGTFAMHVCAFVRAANEETGSRDRLPCVRQAPEN